MAWRTFAETHSLTKRVDRIEIKITATLAHPSSIIWALSSNPIPPAPHETDNRRLANIDIPAEYRDPGKCRQNLRHDSIVKRLRSAGTSCRDRLNLVLVYFLNGLIQEFDAKPD